MPDRVVRRLAWAFLASVVLLIGMAGAVVFHLVHKTLTMTELSPDRMLVATFWEPSSSNIDRNFLVEICDSATPSTPVFVFRSPDEGRPPGTERFLWSRDSQYLLLVSRHVFVKPTVLLPTEKKLYLLWHRKTGQWWCNAKNLGEEKPFALADVTRAGFDL